ncbi:hypothetical protein [Maricaulis maris]|uniref:hypothetical protein n=1 Tax=Maricaulis maris TaxID=74318 RepID=UPI003B8E7AE9
MSKLVFNNPRKKLSRAARHIQTAEQLAKQFADKAKPELVPICVYPVEGETNKVLYELRFSSPPPEDFPLVVGDTLHNLRSALDILICDIAELRGKRRVFSFPFAANEEQLNDLMDKKGVSKLGNDVVEKIKYLAPYKGGNRGLRALHDLNIIDKHRNPISIFMFTRARIAMPPQFNDFVASHTGLNLNNSVMPLREGSRAVAREGTNPWSLFGSIDGPPAPFFPEAVPFEGEPVIGTLNGLLRMTEEIVQIFENGIEPN